jgi:hypothetical protein
MSIRSNGTCHVRCSYQEYGIHLLIHSYTVFYINAHRRYSVSCELALKQLNGFLDRQNIDTSKLVGRFEARRTRYQEWRASLLSLEVPAGDGIVRVPHLISRLRESLPQNTTVVIEAVTNAISVIHHLNLTKVCRDSIPPMHAAYLLIIEIAREPPRNGRRWARMAWRRSNGREARKAE